jgi:glycosyltransferase involved in cell wall biosynthesis
MTRNGINISVVMATYNGAAFLETQLASIYKQTILPAEVIVCDDGSVDNTPIILKRYAQKYGLQYYINEKRLGVISNFKKAVSKAAPYNAIALADQDDYWVPGKLEQLKAALESIDNEVSPAFVYSDLSIMNADEKIINPSFWNEWHYDTYLHCLNTLLFGNFITGCSVMMNSAMRHHFLQMPDDVEMHDAWMALIGFAIGKTFAIKTPLVYYRKHASNAAYIKDNKREKGLKKIINFAAKIIKGDDYLTDRMLLTEQFKSQYQHQLSTENLTIINQFLKRKNKPYFLRKLYFVQVFRKFKTLPS